MAAPVSFREIDCNANEGENGNKPTLSGRAERIESDFENNLISTGEADTLATKLLEEVVGLLEEEAPNLEEARCVLAILLRVSVGSIFETALERLVPLLSPSTFAFDIQNHQGKALSRLERQVRRSLFQLVAQSGVSHSGLASLLSIYTNVLERIWLVVYREDNDELWNEVIFQGVPDILQAVEIVKAVIQSHVKESEEVASQYQMCVSASESLKARPGKGLIADLQKLNPSEDDPRYFFALGQLCCQINNFHRAVFYLEQAEARISEGDDPQKDIQPQLFHLLAVSNRITGHLPEACRYNELALSLAQSASDWYQIARACINLGDVWFLLGNFSKVLEYGHLGLKAAQEISNKGMEGQSWLNIGRGHHYFGKYTQAISAFQSALQNAEQGGDVSTLGSAHSDLSISLRCIGKIPEAIDEAEKAITYGKASGNLEVIVIGLASIGICHLEKSEFDQAHEKQTEALSFCRSMRTSRLRGRIFLNMGNIALAEHKFEEAIDFYNKALKLAKKLGDKGSQGRCFGQLADVYHALGEYGQAIDFQFKSIAIFDEGQDIRASGKAKHRLAKSYYLNGENGRARDFANQSFEIAQSIEDKETETLALCGLAATFSFEGDYAQAILIYQQALEVQEQSIDASGSEMVLLNLGECFASQGNVPEAISHLNRAIEIISNTGGMKKKMLARALLNQGRLFAAQDIGKSIELFEQSLEISKTLNDQMAMTLAYQSLGVVYRLDNDFEKAEEAYNEATNVLTNIRFSLGDHFEARIAIFDKQAKVYHQLESLYLASERNRDALGVSESRRACVLNNRLARFVPNYVNAPLDVEAIEALAHDLGTTFVIYSYNDDLVEEDRLGVWVVRPNSPCVFKRIDVPDFLKGVDKQGVPAYLREVTPKEKTKGIDALFANLPNTPVVDAAVEESKAFLKELYNSLIEPIHGLLPSNQDASLTIVPEGPLSLVPFHALTSPENELLIQTYYVQISPSVESSKLVQMRAPSEEVRDEIFIIGNPTTEHNPLEYATSEAEAVAALFPGTHPHLEEEATVRQFMERAPLARRMLVSSHASGAAKRDPHSVFSGAFHFSPHGGEPGELHASQIMDMDLSNIDVAVLSACETGQGDVKREATTGLVYALHSAGVRTIVGTLWPIKDTAFVSGLVQKYFAHLKGESEEAHSRGCAFGKLEAYRAIILEAMDHSEVNLLDWACLFFLGEA